jgi:hypothetical protein
MDAAAKDHRHEPGYDCRLDFTTTNLVETAMDDDQQPKPLTLRQMLQSVLAGALGVQSGKNRQRDFSHGKPSHFIFLGIGFTLIFVLVILGVVKLVLYLVGL